MTSEIEPIALDERTFVLALTGAGVSAESGVPTFRDSNGLWEQHRFEDVASPEGFRADPALVWRFYSQRRAGAAKVAPNPGHVALAELEARLGERFLLATQNVDGLHRRAGSERLVEMHGQLFTSRCADCDRAPFPDARAYPDGHVPPCDECGGRLRPHIVWFGEMLDPKDLQRINDFLERARGNKLVFLAAGTSGQVYPAAGLVSVARMYGAQSFLVNADPAENTAAFDHFIQGRSGVVLPKLLGSR